MLQAVLREVSYSVSLPNYLPNASLNLMLDYVTNPLLYYMSNSVINAASDLLHDAEPKRLQTPSGKVQTPPKQVLQQR